VGSRRFQVLWAEARQADLERSPQRRLRSIQVAAAVVDAADRVEHARLHERLTREQFRTSLNIRCRGVVVGITGSTGINLQQGRDEISGPVIERELVPEGVLTRSCSKER
jgi:hypothetical protein